MPMHYPKSEPEWLTLRHQYVSSTESAALFGLGSYQTPYELGLSKQSKDPPAPIDQNERVLWGKRLQEAVAKGISDDFGVKVRRVTGYAVHADSRLGASFDYEVIGIKMEEDGKTEVKVKDPMLQQMYRDLGPGVLEIKNVDRFIFRKEWKSEDGDLEAPPQFEIQVQHQLEAISTRMWAAIGVLVGGNEALVVVRDYDPEFGEQIRAKVDEFYANLEKGILPPITLPQDVEIIRRIYLASSPGKLYNGNEDKELAELAAEYTTAMEARNGWEEARKSAGAKILMRIGDAEKAICQMRGKQLVTIGDRKVEQEIIRKYSITANTVGECLVPAYTRKAYRNTRITEKVEAAK